MDRWFWVCVGGALGTGVRYGVALWANDRFGAALPYGTLIVNLMGCFAMALVMETALHVASFPPVLRLALTTGFMGGLTTYSAFNYDVTRMISDGHWGTAALYFLLTAAGCFGAGLAGMALSRRLVGWS